MADQRKFVLGRGEYLTDRVKISRSGGVKNPPYDFSEAVSRTRAFLAKANASFDGLPSKACPNDRVVASVTIHPRYIAKSEFPTDLFDQVGLATVGGRSSFVIPEKWGVGRHPEGAISDTLFVAGERAKFRNWAEGLSSWSPALPAGRQLQYLEGIFSSPNADRIKTPQNELRGGVFETVLHSDGTTEILDAFYDYLADLDAHPLKRRVRRAAGVLFVPVEADPSEVEPIASFSFLRALRQMPRIRTFRPPVLRSDFTPLPELPELGKSIDDCRVAIFDGGLPQDSVLNSWVTAIDPPGIGAPAEDALDHGEQVTSAFLFGHLTPRTAVASPYSVVDHVRVISQEDSSSSDDCELYDVLDRIVNHLDTAEVAYKFANLSLGPDLPIEDEEITAWTAELDQRAATGKIVISCAVGNSGEADSATRLNRIQPPSDGVNLLSVGACTEFEGDWERCAYSSVGPGRTPGVAKPDGVAFGGLFERPFGVVSRSAGGGLGATAGTSFSTPVALRTAVGLHALSSGELEPLAVRALVIHTAEANDLPLAEVGWGRFRSHPIDAMTCTDTEVTVIYQGELPLGEYLRAVIPTPPTPLTGLVEIQATLTIAPEVDPAFCNAYTRAGMEAVFRPHRKKLSSGASHAKPRSFFSAKNLFHAAEFELRRDHHKWEPCWRASEKLRGSSLNGPCFDIYYHHRSEGRVEQDPQPIPYALVVTLRAPKVSNLYDVVLDTYSEILVPIEPVIDVPVTV